MKNIYMVVQYDGTRYSGWQRQGNSKNTIQGRIENVLSKMVSEKIEIVGSGRTDAGVHSNGQAINFHIETEKSAKEIMKYVNTYLPEDISVISSKEVSERFHSRYNCGGKKYCYTIDTSEKADVFLRKFSWNIPEKMDLAKMKKASEYLIGKHDFSSYTDVKKTNKSLEKTIEKIDITKKGNLLIIKIKGDGFLYHMVRIIVGTLVEVGKGQKTPKDVQEILKEKTRSSAGELAPAKGLTLEKVYY